MIGLDVQTLLGILIGTGGVGGITVIVTSYRRIKTGKISDEESLIKRLHRELTRQETRADIAEADAEREVVQKKHWREQAWQYRLQLIDAGVTPNDMEVPKDEVVS